MGRKGLWGNRVGSHRARILMLPTSSRAFGARRAGARIRGIIPRAKVATLPLRVSADGQSHAPFVRPIVSRTSPPLPDRGGVEVSRQARRSRGSWVLLGHEFAAVTPHRSQERNTIENLAGSRRPTWERPRARAKPGSPERLFVVHRNARELVLGPDAAQVRPCARAPSTGRERLFVGKRTSARFPDESLKPSSRDRSSFLQDTFREASCSVCRSGMDSTRSS
jgi:hypothetical protein